MGEILASSSAINAPFKKAMVIEILSFALLMLATRAGGFIVLE
jgi:hypothetical protein